MVRKSTHVFRRRSRSGAAMALALAAGGLVVTAVLPSSAAAQRVSRDRPQQESAQRQQAQAGPSYSREFVAVYQPVADIANAEAGDFAAARSRLSAVHAAVTNDDERHAAGSLTLILGNKLSDPALQRRGLEMMLQSGKVAPAQVAQMHFLVGNLAAVAKDWAAARTALQAAVDAGYSEDNPQGLIAETYFSEGQTAQGLDYLKGVIRQFQSSGRQVPESWVIRGLQQAYTGGFADQATDFSTLLVAGNPSQQNWLQSLQVVNVMNQFEPQVRLDLLRLMLATDALSERPEFVSYIEAADVRVMANEVLRVLERGVQKGVFTTSDPYYVEIKGIADERAPVDRRDAPSLAAEARGAARGTSAQSAGDVFFSLENYAEAEAMYALALEKGGVDRDRNLTRLGIAQALQGKNAEAKATLQQVGGSRTPVARMWIAYVDSKA